MINLNLVLEPNEVQEVPISLSCSETRTMLILTGIEPLNKKLIFLKILKGILKLQITKVSENFKNIDQTFWNTKAGTGPDIDKRLQQCRSLSVIW
jgi:hypothetical protein